MSSNSTMLQNRETVCNYARVDEGQETDITE